jgi:enamine deaminase RidA (YjgF/YER057c/UK114 family)
MIQHHRSGTASLLWRRFSGPLANEIHVHCRPLPEQESDIAHQTSSVYAALDSLLRQEKGSLGNVISETVFFRNIGRDCKRFQKMHLQAFETSAGAPSLLPALTCIGQPPLDAHADLVLNAIAIIPCRRPLQGGSPSTPAAGRSFVLGDQKHLYAGNIYGTSGSAFDQAYTMFCQADEMLEREGMNFRDVMRTWIYLREMERDYAEFNRARREFLRQRNITLLPASTGIHGSPSPKTADFTLSFHAIKSPQGVRATAMTTPTLNEAHTYGSDFSRGLRVVEEIKVALYISGTASVDEEGRTAHIDDFEAQVSRMLLNVETLLSMQKASFQNVLSAVTYLKTPDDAPLLHRILRDRGLDDIPNALVHAAVCRPDLLCEMEAIAALPLE